MLRFEFLELKSDTCQQSLLYCYQQLKSFPRLWIYDIAVNHRYSSKHFLDF